MIFKRPPDFVIGAADDPQLIRWYIIPRNRFFNIYLHKFLRSDEDRALHDHPWWSLGIIIKGEYLEHVPDTTTLWKIFDIEMTLWDRFRATLAIHRKAWRPVLRSSKSIHRIQLFSIEKDTGAFKPVWTIFITGPKIREWGFWCPKGWRHNNEFVSRRPGGNAIGRGCED